MACNPFERTEKNESFPTYRAMIGRFNQALKDLRVEMKTTNVYMQRDIYKERAEIEDLKRQMQTS